MASLANQTISSTYDGLVKTATDQPVGVSGVQLLEDGVGNSLALSVGRANQGVTVTGPLTGTLSATSVLADGVIATTQATSDNSTKVATTAYVKSVVTAEDLDIAGDSGTGAVDLDSQTLTIEGTANEIETSASGQTITIGLPSTITANVTGNVSGNLTGTVLTAAQANITSVGTLSSLAVSGNLIVDTDTLFVDSVNKRVGIKTSSPATSLDVNGSIQSSVAIINDGSNESGFNANSRIRISRGAGPSFLQFISPNTQEQGVLFGDPDDTVMGSIRYDHSGDFMYFEVNNAEAMRINSSRNLVFPNGNGIDFSASEGGGATSSLLDDYEEGTFTVAISTNTGSVTMNTNFDAAFYTKIGGLVTVGGFVNVLSVSSPTGFIAISLPFTPVTTPDSSGSASGSVIVSHSVSKNAGDFVCGESAGALRIFIADVNISSSSNANAEQLKAGTFITFSFTYKTF